MFGRLTDLLNNIKNLNQEKIFVKIVSSQGVQSFILSLNLTDQLFVGGVNADGDSLGQYSDFTEKTGESFTVERYFLDDVGFVHVENISKSVGVGDDYTLLETGDLYGKYRVDVDGDGFTISADTNKKEVNGDVVDIQSSYGKIVGLNEKSKTELAEAIIPLVVQETRRLLLS